MMQNFVTREVTNISKFKLLLGASIILVGISCTPKTVKTTTSHHATNEVLVELPTDEKGGDAFLQITRDDHETHKFPIDFIFQDMQIRTYDISSMVVQDLNKDNEPEIVLEVFTRGSNCCTVIAIIYYNQNLGQYKSSNLLIRNWGISPKLVDINEDRIIEFVTRDPDHKWLAPSAAAASPIQVFRFNEGQLTDATIQYPDMLQQDANLWLASAQGKTADLSDSYLKITREDPHYWATVFEGREYIALSTYLFEMTLLGKGDEGWIQANTICKDNTCEYLNTMYQEITQE